MALWLNSLEWLVDNFINDLGNAYLSMSTHPVWSACECQCRDFHIYSFYCGVFMFNDAIVLASAPLSFAKPSHLPQWQQSLWRKPRPQQHVHRHLCICVTIYRSLLHFNDLYASKHSSCNNTPIIIIIPLNVKIDVEKKRLENSANATKFAVKCSEINFMRRIPLVHTS